MPTMVMMATRIKSGMRNNSVARRRARVVLMANKNRSCSHHKFTFEPSVEHTHQVPSLLYLEQTPLLYLPYPTNRDAGHDHRKQSQELNHSSSGGLVAVIANHLFYSISTDTTLISIIKPSRPLAWSVRATSHQNAPHRIQTPAPYFSRSIPVP